MMARLPSQAAAGLARRLLHSSSNNEAFSKLGIAGGSLEKSSSCVSCVLWPLATLSNRAFGWSGLQQHAYHRGGSNGNSSTDEEQQQQHATSSSSKEKQQSATSSSSSRSSSQDKGVAPAAPTQQLRDLRQALQQQRQQDSDVHEARQLPDHVARMAMRDPLGVLISSLGVPLGISLKVNRSEVLQHNADDRRSALDEFDLHETIRQVTDQLAAARAAGEARAAAAGLEPLSDLEEESDEEEQLALMDSLAADSGRDPSTSVPDTDMQLHQQELHKQTRSFARRRRQTASSQQAAAAEAEAAAEAACTGTGSVHQHLESIRAMIKASSSAADRWGTMQQSPAEIAQQIADSNRAAAGGGGGGGDGGSGSDDEDGGGEGGEDGDEPLRLSPEEERYVDASAVASDLKEMDEIFEVLAKVPWLDGEDVDERELRGLAAVGLLGTLEEVGWTIRDKLLALWGGERDEAVLTAGLGPREASAMAAILYHTQQLEAQFGKPPPESVQAALQAASVEGGDGEQH